jgi:hypothetical protein
MSYLQQLLILSQPVDSCRRRVTAFVCDLFRGISLLDQPKSLPCAAKAPTRADAIRQIKQFLAGKYEHPNRCC